MRQKEMLYYMLAEYYEKGGDFMDSLLPFIEYCLAENVPSKITSKSLKDLVENEYPLEYPLAVYESILGKFVANELLTPVTFDGVVYFEPIKGFHSRNVNSKRVEFQRSIDLLGLEFTRFAKVMDKDYSINDSKTLVIGFLIKNMEAMLSIIDNKLVHATDLPDEDKLVSMFLIEEFEKATDTIRCVNVIIKGVLCYKYLYYKRDKDVSNDLRGLKVFLDTAIVIYALGYAGEIRKQLAVELISQLKKRHAQIYCYEHSLREIMDILSACEHIIIERGSGFGAMRYTVEHFLSQPDSLTEISLAAQNLRNDIEENAGIGLFEELLYESQDRNPFLSESELAILIAKEMHIETTNQERAEADAKSINLTSYLRNGVCANELADAKAVFITQNWLLAKISSKFLNENQFIIPATFHYSNFSTLLLLSDEVTEPNLPLIIVIENCYAAVAPSDAQWKVYIEKLNNKKDEGKIADIDYLKFRSMRFARKPLLKFELDHTPITMISIEEVQRLDSERIQMEAEKVRDEERIAAGVILTSAINDKNKAVSERNDVLSGIDKMKIDKKELVHKVFKGLRIGFILLIVLFSILSIFTQLSKPVLCLSALVSIVGAFATFFPKQFFNIEEKYIERSNRKIDNYLNPSTSISTNFSQ